MIINNPKVGKYCDGGWGCKCGNPHRSGGCTKHPDTIVLDCVCIDCENGGEKEKLIRNIKIQTAPNSPKPQSEYQEGFQEGVKRAIQVIEKENYIDP